MQSTHQMSYPQTLYRQLLSGDYSPASWLPRIPRPPLLAIFALLIVIVVLLPVGYLVLRAAASGQAGVDYLFRPRTLSIISNSLLLTAAVVGTSALIGVPFAWLTVRTNLRGRRFWLIGGLLTMVMPSYVGAAAYVWFFGPVGMLQKWLAPLGIERLPEIYGFFGAWLSITIFTFPYIVLPVRAALLNMDAAQEEAARGMGMGRWRVFLRVTLPQLRPALASGMLLVALYTLSDFGAVAVMRYNAFTRAIYMQHDRDKAAILALVLVGITLVLMLLEQRTSTHKRNHRVGVGTCRTPRTVNLGRWHIPALIFCASIVLIGVVIPVGVLLHWTFAREAQSSLNINMGELFANTLSVSAGAALVVGLVALPLGILAVRSRGRAGKVLVRLTYLSNALPGVVVALALVSFTAQNLPLFYLTLPLLILGYGTRFLPLSIGATSSALTQISPRLEEAARCLGLRPYQVTLRVTAPLASAGIFAGMALVFLNVMKELPTTLILRPTGFDTLATRIWTAQDSASYGLIGLPGLLLMAASALALGVALWREKQT